MCPMTWMGNKMEELSTFFETSLGLYGGTMIKHELSKQVAEGPLS